jgi:hypothetical protein
MRGRGKKSSGRGLKPLPPEDAAALAAQVARVRQALEGRPDPEALKDLVTTRPQDPAWDLHLLTALESLPHPAIPPLLAALFAGVRDRDRVKALKRALHHFKTRGVVVPPELLPREEAPRPRPAGETAAQFSPVFGNGEQFVVLEAPREVLGGNFLVSRVSDQEGFRECVLLNLKRHQVEGFWQHFRDQGLSDWAPASPAHALVLLEEAYRLHPQAEAAAQYAALRERLLRLWGPAAASPLPPLEEEDRGRSLEQSRELPFDPLFRFWMPPAEELTPWLARLREVQDSPLVLTEPQRQSRLQDVVAAAVRALYPPEARPRWQRRLLAMAAFFHLRGRPDQARAAQAAARDLAEERSPLTGEPVFLTALVQHALRLAEQMERGPEAPTPSGLVLPPSQQSLIVRR